MKTVLFACIHNAGRSQMAAAWFNELANPTVARAISAGTQPGARVHPEVVSAMQEEGVDLSGEVPRFLSDELAQSAALLVTMGCGEACPAVSGVRRADWPLDDPKGKPLPRVRQIRDDIRARVEQLLLAEGWARAAEGTSEATFDRLTSSDLPAVLHLLERCGLPTADVGDNHEAFIVARSGERVLGCCGLETYGAEGLLRSLAVDPASRGRGLGAALVERTAQRAQRQGLLRLYLLTTTAREYFTRLGFVQCARDEAPPNIRASWQFRTGCPESAVCMTRALQAAAIEAR